MNRFAFSIGLLSLGSASFIHAAEQAETIVVTATRTAQTVDETLAPVTVIGRAEIEASQAGNVLELLQNRVIGLDVSRNGGPGSLTSLFLRGSESDHVLVLVDGVRVASATDGGFNWSSLNPAQIERIEIVRGPHSTLYGSDAIGGVIQIFTRRSEGFQMSFGTGSYRSREMSIGAGGKAGQGDVHLNFATSKSDGFSATDADHGNHESDDDGYKNSSLTAGYARPLGADLALDIDLSLAQGEVEYDTAQPDSYANTENSAASVALDWQTSEQWSQRIAVTAGRDRYDSHDSWPVVITTDRQGASWQNDVEIGSASLLTAGLDYQDDRAENRGTLDKAITNRALFLQYQWGNELLDLVAGVRNDDHSGFGGHTTGRLALGTRLGAGRLVASHGTAFKAPSFNELYYPWFGNPDLKPEESTSSELGYRIGAFEATLFKNDVTNMIVSDPNTWMATNLEEVSVEGAELSYRLEVSDWQVVSGLTLQSAENVTTGDKLLRRADEKLFVNASGAVAANTTLGVELSYTGAAPDRYFDSTTFSTVDVELDAYTLINLTASHQLDRRWRLSGRIENLTDEEYRIAHGYNTPGASAYLTLSYQE